jgi:hypothetical protein
MRLRTLLSGCLGLALGAWADLRPLGLEDIGRSQRVPSVGQSVTYVIAPAERLWHNLRAPALPVAIAPSGEPRCRRQGLEGEAPQAPRRPLSRRPEAGSPGNGSPPASRSCWPAGFALHGTVARPQGGSPAG